MFNGSTLSFAGDVSNVIGITYRANGKTVEVTEPEDLYALFEVGTVDLEVTIKLRGGAGIAVKATGELSITWRDGSTSTCPGTWICSAAETSGDQDSAIGGSVTFKPTVDVT
jgi:hypothetical protein